MGLRNSTKLKGLMSGRWLSAFMSLAPSLQYAIDKLGHNVPCPVDGGTDGFRLFNDADETGGGVKQSWRVIPEGIDMLMWVNNWSFTQTYDELESWLGNKPFESGPIYLPKPKSVDDTWCRNWLNRIWQESLTLDQTMSYPARAYLVSRRMLPAALAARNIRFHPNLPYKDGKQVLGTFGAVLCKVHNNDGEPVQIARTFILKDGRKIDLGKSHKAKKSTPPVRKASKGRHVPLFAPINGYLGVSEGLETALAVYQGKQFPVWPNLSNTNLHTFVSPSGVHTVLNFIDKDRSKAGENSAEVLRCHLESQGVRVLDLIPPTPILETDEKGVDWADQLIRDRSGFDLIDQLLY